MAAQRHPEYEKRVFEQYARQRPDIVGNATSYDDLRKAAYQQLLGETVRQFHAMPVNLSYHRNGEGNYPDSRTMAHDVVHNNHLAVYQGGEPHEFLHEVDPATKLSANDMFRAVHDYFGHAAHGTSFGPQGEEKAWAAHSALFSPLAHAALTSETRGQNSFVNYSPINALLKSRVAKLTEAIANANRYGDTEDARKLSEQRQELLNGFQYAKQAAVLLPPEMLRGDYAGGVPEYLRDLVKPAHGVSADLVHYSHAPGLKQTDPRFYGTGIKGEDTARAKGNAPDRTYFYLGEPRQREGGLGIHKYKATVPGLYDLAADPENLHQLSQESNRAPAGAAYNAGIVDRDAAANDLERMAQERGYTGVLNPTGRIAAVFNPTEVQSYAKGGIVSALDSALDRIKRKKGSYDEFAAELRAMPGVKPAEIQARLRSPNAVQSMHYGYDPNNLTLEGFRKAVRPLSTPEVREIRPRDRLADFGGPEGEGEEHNDYSKYTLPGGENYREMLLRRPVSHGVPTFVSSHFGGIPNVLAHARLKDRTGPNGEKVLHVEELQSDWHQAGRKHGYRTLEATKMMEQASKDAAAARRELQGAKDDVLWAELQGNTEARNVAANRVAELTGPALRTQAQFDDIMRTEKKRVPDAPFKKDWHETLLKHLLVHAAKNGYDTLAVTPGEEQARRYDLSKHIQRVVYNPQAKGLVAYDRNGKAVLNPTGLPPEKVADYLGEDVARKLLSSAPDPEHGVHVLENADLRMGGEGMKGFYDKMVPAYLNKVGRPYGAQVGTMPLEVPKPAPTLGDAMDALRAQGRSEAEANSDPRGVSAMLAMLQAEHARNPSREVQLHSLAITPQMRESINTEGLPLYAKGGDVRAPKDEKMTPARMRAEIAAHAAKKRKASPDFSTLSKVLGSDPADIGADEAPDSPIKGYMDPDRGKPMHIPTGGVTLPNGQLLPPTGLQPQQAAPGAPQPGQGVPGAPPGIPPAILALLSGAHPNPAAPVAGMPPGVRPAPQAPSNILTMMRQGQALKAMQPPGVPAMAKGGAVGSRKYKTGQYVTTEWTTRNNHNPMKIVSVKGTKANPVYGIEHDIDGKRVKYDIPEGAITGAVSA